jgi:hypothetical protein
VLLVWLFSKIIFSHSLPRTSGFFWARYNFCFFRYMDCFSDSKKERMWTTTLLAGLFVLWGLKSFSPWPHDLILRGTRDGMLRNYGLEDMRNFARDFDKLPHISINDVGGQEPQSFAPASWTAPALWRFSTANPSTSNSSLIAKLAAQIEFGKFCLKMPSALNDLLKATSRSFYPSLPTRP